MDTILAGAAVLLLLSVLASKISDRFGIPALVLFLGIGMLAGSDGLGGIYFDNPQLAQSLGTIALIVILYSGGLDTPWKEIRRVLPEGISLATVGVAATALLAGLFAHYILGVSVYEGILVGVIISSTDAAAVFALLRSRGVLLKPKVKSLLELESGSNDPMAIFLTVSVAQMLLDPNLSWWGLLPKLLQQMLFGLAAGVLMGRLLLWLVNRLRLGNLSLYPLLTLGAVFLVFSLTNLAGGSGFLAVYVTGLIMGRADFIHKRSLLRFYDSMAWLNQIVMFLMLGLLVFPSRLVQVWAPALGIAVFLMLAARPLSVLLALLPFRYKLSEKVFISWVGLRGAVPIILAVYPRMMGLPNSDLIFNIVFFVVISSVLLQGTTIPLAARLLRVEAPPADAPAYPIELAPGVEWEGVLREAAVGQGSWAVGRAIYELGLPEQYLVVLVARGTEFVIPTGGVTLQAGDKLLGLARPEAHSEVEDLLRRPALDESEENESTLL